MNEWIESAFLPADGARFVGRFSSDRSYANGEFDCRRCGDSVLYPDADGEIVELPITHPAFVAWRPLPEQGDEAPPHVPGWLKAG